MGNMWASESLADISSPLESSAGASDEELKEAAESSITALRGKYRNVKQVIYTFRLEKDYWALFHNNDGTVTSKKYKIGDAIDRVGSGDCFMAGIIYANLQKMPAQEIINFAAAAAVGKLYEKGDHTQQTVDVIQKRYS
jgi:2-dehydro-3-deoxygluconokinase